MELVNCIITICTKCAVCVRGAPPTFCSNIQDPEHSEQNMEYSRQKDGRPGYNLWYMCVAESTCDY